MSTPTVNLTEVLRATFAGRDPATLDPALRALIAADARPLIITRANAVRAAEALFTAVDAAAKGGAA